MKINLVASINEWVTAIESIETNKMFLAYKKKAVLAIVRFLHWILVSANLSIEEKEKPPAPVIRLLLNITFVKETRDY